jgi:hypothetical protein
MGDPARRPVNEEAGKLESVQAVVLDDAPIPAGDGEFKHILCQADTNGRKVRGLDSFWKGFSCSFQPQLGTPMPYCNREESISSIGAGR